MQLVTIPQWLAEVGIGNFAIKKSVSNITTIAIIGAAENEGFLVAKRFASKYHVLLFDKDEEKLTAVHHKILATNPTANAEAMVCPTKASWEADIIVVTGNYCSDHEIADKIREVATGKIVLIILDELNDDMFSNPAGSLQLLLPYSKVIQVFNATDSIKELILEGNDEEALETVTDIFESVGFKTVNFLTNSINN